MFRSTMVNMGLANRIVKNCSERQYHMISKQPSQNASLLQAGITPGTPPTMFFPEPLRNQPGWVPSRLFTTEYIKKNLGVTPIIVLMGCWAAGVAGYCIYAMMTRDYEYSKTGKKQSEMVDLRNPRPLKMVTINETYRPHPELADLLDEINRAEKQAEN